MKSRNILITIGIVLILFNAISYSGSGFNPPEDKSERVGYYIGFNIFFIAGLVLLIIAYLKHKKAIRKKEKNMLDNFLN